MTGSILQVDSSELGKIGVKLDRYAARVTDLTPLMDDIGAMLVASTQDRFEKGVDPEGKTWKVSGRVAKAQGNAQTLVDSGLLLSSVHHEPHPDSVEVGTNMIYAAIHQNGGQAGRGRAVTIPARPFLGLSTDDKTEIGHIVDDFYGGLFQ